MDFDWENIGSILTYLLPVLAFVFINIFFRKRQER